MTNSTQDFVKNLEGMKQRVLGGMKEKVGSIAISRPCRGGQLLRSRPTISDPREHKILKSHRSEAGQTGSLKAEQETADEAVRNFAQEKPVKSHLS